MKKFNEIDPAVDLEHNQIRVRLFGNLEMDNKYGHMDDVTARCHAITWLTLKYILVNSNRDVDQDEFMAFTFEGKPITEQDGAMRTRLQRTRTLLVPLGLEGRNGLILFSSGKFRINPDFELIIDEKEFTNILDRLDNLPVDAPEGIDLCMEALDLCRGEFLAYTDDSGWLKPYRDHYKRELINLCDDTMERMRALHDYRASELLWRRAAAVIPVDNRVHQDIFRFLVEKRQRHEIPRYVSQLYLKGASWINDFEY